MIAINLPRANLQNNTSKFDYKNWLFCRVFKWYDCLGKSCKRNL